MILFTGAADVAVVAAAEDARPRLPMHGDGDCNNAGAGGTVAWAVAAGAS